MIIPLYDPNFNYDDKGLSHSYPETPPIYSEPQILYSYTYDGFMNNLPGNKIYNWYVNFPFLIVSGQGTKTITVQQMPKLTKDREPIVKANTTTYRDLKYSDLDLNINGLKESINLYYRQGPLWRIEGNKTPKIIYSVDGKSQTIETYKILPQYNMSGYPPKNIINIESYKFIVQNGSVIRIHGGNPPDSYPLVDILWHTKGPGYISFYSSWKDDYVKFPNTTPVIVS